MKSDAHVRLLNAVAACLRRHSPKYGDVQATGDSLVVMTPDGAVSLVVSQPDPAGREFTPVDLEELSDLRQEARKLRALETAGVDNWTGYDYAMELYREGEDA